MPQFQQKHESIVIVWVFVVIQSKIEIHKHLNSSWHKIIKMTVHIGEDTRGCGNLMSRVSGFEGLKVIHCKLFEK